MSVLTSFLKLLKMDGETDGTKTFNVQTMLNDNWDKIDNATHDHATDISKHIPRATNATVSSNNLHIDLPEVQGTEPYDGLSFWVKMPENVGSRTTIQFITLNGSSSGRMIVVPNGDGFAYTGMGAFTAKCWYLFIYMGDNYILQSNFGMQVLTIHLKRYEVKHLLVVWLVHPQKVTALLNLPIRNLL